MNVTREIDNFFPGTFDYFNVRVYDDDKTDLLKHWDNTYRYITRAKKEGSKVLVHCKMGVSRSASVVIAYAMKAFNWEFEHALKHVKERRNCIKPNKNFLNQLETYRGMLDAMKNKEKLQRSKSETNLKSSSTKDARLLPGSEPTPLIQALNRNNKSKSAGTAVVELDTAVVDLDAMSAATTPRTRTVLASIDKEINAITMVSLRGIGDSSNQRRLLRRSSSTSPKCLQKTLPATIVAASATTIATNEGASMTASAVIVIKKQQSQSMENLTPERSVADEPKNVRFPGSNGENYSVTQNQVLHIQKNTPPPPPPPPPPTPPINCGTQTLPIVVSTSAAAVSTSVRNIIHDLEEGSSVLRKTSEDRKTLNLPFARSISHDTGEELPSPGSNSIKSMGIGSPVWTSSAKLITQISLINTTENQPTSSARSSHSLRSSLRMRRDTNESAKSDSACLAEAADTTLSAEELAKRLPGHHCRKTQSWAASSNSSISGGIKLDLESTKLGSNSSIDSVASSNAYEGPFVRTRQRPRDHPSRHASWGSGDTRCSLMRNSSLNSYDANRNTFQFGGTSAIFEGQIHDMHSSHNAIGKTASEDGAAINSSHQGTVKRTKQKLEESNASLKKMCQENGSGEHPAPPKRSSNLYRSASARCNSNELVGSGSSITKSLRRSGGSRPLNATELFSTGAGSCAYTFSDIENKNTPSSHTDEEDEEESVVLRDSSVSVAEQKRISAGSVQILKKNFEAKAGAGAASNAANTQSLTATSGTAVPAVEKRNK